MRWQPVSQPFVGKHACVQFCGRNHKFVTILTFRKLFYKLFFTPSFCSFVMQLAYKINNIPGPLGICKTKILYSKCSIIKTALAVIVQKPALTRTNQRRQGVSRRVFFPTLFRIITLIRLHRHLHCRIAIGLRLDHSEGRVTPQLSFPELVGLVRFKGCKAVACLRIKNIVRGSF